MPRSPGWSPAIRTVAAAAAAYSPPPAAIRSQPAATAATRAARPSAGQVRMAPSAAVSAAGPAAPAGSARSQVRGERVELAHLEGAEQRGGVRRGPQPGQYLEPGERAEDLRLGPVVDVVARLVARRQPALGSPPGTRPRPAPVTGAPEWTAPSRRRAPSAGTAAGRRTARRTPRRARRRVRGDHRVERGPAAGARARRTAPTGARPSTAPPRARRSGRGAPAARRSPCAIPTRTAG